MMRRLLLPLALISAAPAPVAVVPSPSEIVAAAPAKDWVAIAPSDLLVMDLAADAKGKPRRVVIQLMPAPFSQGWIGNIRALANAHWWDGTSINRVQDNYVVQWGDVTEKKPLPPGLASVGESEYSAPSSTAEGFRFHQWELWSGSQMWGGAPPPSPIFDPAPAFRSEIHGYTDNFYRGFAFTSALSPHSAQVFPIHCYGMVGVGRNLPPDTGSGAELYTVIGQAPRHLDRNIALVGRVIEGIENLSSLPRGTGALGFYENAEERVPIVSVRLANALPADKPFPRYEYLSTESPSFAKYADARANRRDPFFIKAAGGADICNIPVPVRRAP